MRCLAVSAQKSRLDALFKQVSEVRNDAALELTSHWAKYLCVLCSGFMETSVETIFTEYAKNKGTPEEIVQFTRYRLKRLGNLGCEEFLSLIAHFAPEWRAALEPAITDDMRAAINSINTNRNRIAHGLDVQLSFVRVSDYFKLAARAVDLLDEMVNA